MGVGLGTGADSEADSGTGAIYRLSMRKEVALWTMDEEGSRHWALDDTTHYQVVYKALCIYYNALRVRLHINDMLKTEKFFL